jgi:hypothetical protein
MNPNELSSRNHILHLLDVTRQGTRSLLTPLEPGLVVHQDERSWQVRDVIGHLGAWNWEAARSILAYSKDSEYTCISSEAAYDDYNGLAAEERRAWTMEQIWAEYDSAHDQLNLLVRTMPDDKWNGELVYPWNEHGSIPHLIEVMMAHEKIDHCARIV